VNMHTAIARRRFLAGFAATAAAAVLAACGGDATTATTPAANPTTAAPAPTTGAAAPTTGSITSPTTGAASAAPTSGATVAATTAPTVAATTGTSATTVATSGAAASPATMATTGSTAATTAPASMSTSASAVGMSGVTFTAPPLTKATAPSKGELRIALGFDFPSKQDALKDSHLAPYGMLETLMRQNEQNKLEPWLAQSLTSINPVTWRLVLRDAKFWDGSPVTSTDVVNAFKKNWDAWVDLKGLISTDTKFNVIDARTLEFVTPQPSALFPYALSLTSTAISKPLPGGADGGLMTGPYKPTKIVVDNSVELEPFKDHWSGIPPIAKITMKYVADPNARILALQSGDTDMLYNFPPESIKTFGPDIEAAATPSGREGLINLNVGKAPFNDRNVREAWALGIDRAVLNQVGLDGRGIVATQMFPAVSGYDTIPLQGTDVARAKQLLDEAGWKPGSDGIRAKGSDRLFFTLVSYPGRADLTPYAVSMQSQLKPLGFDVKVMEVQDIGAATKNGMFDAAMKSNNTLPTGNPLYEYNRLLITGGSDNAGMYTNPQLEDLVKQMRLELDPAKSRDLSLKVQAIVKQDVPVIFLTVTPITTALRKGKIKGYVPNPNDSYLITPAMSVS